ncbi:unnamed protein product [Prunus armeniaca]|uniref:Uncharacterized protein n=1 Tax=Prunus armeniaca TaxID=36596 RepID=A0A6J5X5N3_PRUAR|nr:unnamed protein product [Prunus armeniaca]CAB4309276.1 unnamed protein product [Prunus armeniaca]
MEDEKNIGADKCQKLVEKVEKRKKRIGAGSGEMEIGWGKGRKKEKGMNWRLGKGDTILFGSLAP